MKRSPLIIFILMFALSSQVLAKAVDADYDLKVNALHNALEELKKMSDRKQEVDFKFSRNPFVPLVGSSGKGANLPSGGNDIYGFNLQGIVYEKNSKNVVLIDDKFYSQGDELGPYVILEIKPDGLVAKKGDETVFIPIHPDVDQEAKLNV